MPKKNNLKRYHEKRDFKKTAEPKGKVASGQGFSYLIQKHAATRLHYDFRLELNGTLKSWAVTKGPSLDPADKRLAVEVEDHPVEYGSFEGTIPKGEYGGGTVMLWDVGKWEPIGDPEEGLKKGKLEFVLHGKRLRGEWTLVRMRQREQDKGRNNWLLIKHRDKYAKTDDHDELLEKNDTSVVSRRNMDSIAQGNKVWHSNRSEEVKEAKTLKKKEQNQRCRASSHLNWQRLPTRFLQAMNGCMKSSSMAIASFPMSKIMKRACSRVTVSTGQKNSEMWDGICPRSLWIMRYLTGRLSLSTIKA